MRPLATRWMFLVVLLFARVAWAQGSDDRGAFIERVQWGFGDSMPGERFAPVTVWINGGLEGFSGTVSIEFRQDATQETRVVAAASATPGRTTPVELVCAMPMGCDRAVVRLHGGRKTRELRFSTRGQADALPLSIASGNTFEVLAIGDSGVIAANMTLQNKPIPSIPGARDKMTPEQRATLFWSRVLTTAMKAELPLSWFAYDAVDLVVVRADALMGVDPRRVDALGAWIGAGGRCVVIVDQGLGWRRLLGEGESGDHVRLGEPGMLAPVEDAYTPLGVKPAARVRGRLLTLTAQGERDGWRLIAPASGADGEVGAMIAVGPVGMGMVCVLANDPKDWAGDMSADASVAMWRPVVEGMAPTSAASADEQQWYWYWGGSMGGMYENAALCGSVDRVARIPPLGVSSLVLIGGVVMLLGILLGPVDLIVLKKLGWRHRSWLVALVWIALASVAAGVAPWLIRSGKSEVFRYEAIDVLERGEGVEEWRTGVTAIFSGHPASIELSGMEPGAAWRGVSVIRGGNEGTPRAFGALPIVQRQAETGGREALPGAFGMGQWMLRTMVDQSPGRAARSGEARASVHKEDGVYMVGVEGIAPGAAISRGRLRTSAGWCELAFTRGDEGAWRGRLVGEFTLDPPWGWDEARELSSAWYGQQVSAEGRVDRFSSVISLPGAFDRDAAVVARVSSGRWACVYLEIEGLPAVVRAEGSDAMRRASVRLLVPLGEEDAFARVDQRWPGLSMTEEIR